MIRTIMPGERTGCVSVPSSKSMAHRYLISAALSHGASQIICPGISKDIEATISCLRAMGADIQADAEVITVKPIRQDAGAKRPACILPCAESGSTLRFLLPVVGALGLDAVFKMEGRLPERPMKEYEDVLRSNGMIIERNAAELHCSGRLKSGVFSLPGNISSQYFSGLMFSLPLLKGSSQIIIEGKLESADYFEMTRSVLKDSGISWKENCGIIEVPGDQEYNVPDRINVEGDYSSAAFFLCAGALSESGICVKNLRSDSKQGDSRIVDILRQFGADILQTSDSVMVRARSLKGTDIDASEIPDLIPVLSVVASVAKGRTNITNASRLRLKESDRLSSTSGLLKLLGAQVEETDDGLIIEGRNTLAGGVSADPSNDHRIAMSAAVAACVCEKPVTVENAECVEKSYPDFWKDLDSLNTV